MISAPITQHGAPVERDPLTPRNFFDVDWRETGYRELYAPTDPQLVVTIQPGRWIDDLGEVITTGRVAISLAHGPNAVQLDRASGGIVADAAFQPDSLPLWLVEADAPAQRIVSVIDLRGVPGLAAGA